MFMARRYRMLPISGFSNCSWAERDVDRGRPMVTRNELERANLIFEGYFQALYVPLGGEETQMEFYISMFSDKPPCMPLCFGIGVVIILLEAAEFFFPFFHIFFLSLCSRGFLFFYIFSLSLFFNFFFFLRSLLPLPLLS